MSALCFTFFWVGVGLCFLVPVLFFTVSIGVLVWLWAVAAFVASRYIYGLAYPQTAETSSDGLVSDDKVVIFPQQDHRNGLGSKIKSEASDFKQ